MDDLILEFDEPRSYDRCAVMTFQTNLQGYQMASMLNQCADLLLARNDYSDTFADFAADANEVPPLPIYTYIDESFNRTYNLIDTAPYIRMPQDLASALQWNNMVLFIQGMDCYQQQKHIYSQLTSTLSTAPPFDRLKQEIDARWQTLSDNIIDLQYYNFANRQTPTSSRWTIEGNSPSQRVRQVADRLDQFFSILLEMIETCEYNNKTKNLQK